MTTFFLNTCSVGAIPRGPVPLLDQLDAAASAGYSGVGLDVNTINAFLKSGGRLETARARIDELGLAVLEVHVVRCALPEHHEPRALRAHRDDVRRLSEFAQVLGATWVNGTVHESSTESAVEHLSVCADLVREHGARLSIEFQPEFPCASLSHTAELRHALADQGVGVQVDSWHLFRGPSTVDELRLLSADDISFVQFGDGHPDNAGTDARPLPGDGSFPLASFVAAVRATGYDGAIEVETFVPELMGDDPIGSAKTQLEAVRPFWDSHSTGRLA